MVRVCSFAFFGKCFLSITGYVSSLVVDLGLPKKLLLKPLSVPLSTLKLLYLSFDLATVLFRLASFFKFCFMLPPKTSSPKST